jgi:hypothetical protein
MNFQYLGVKIIGSSKEKRSKTANAQYFIFIIILMQSTGQVDKVKSGHKHVHYTTSVAPESFVSIHLKWRCLMLFMPMSSTYHGI